jgi:hypothetical protein
VRRLETEVHPDVGDSLRPGSALGCRRNGKLLLRWHLEPLVKYLHHLGHDRLYRHGREGRMHGSWLLSVAY